MLKHLIVLPVGGLCNRLCAIASAIRICSLHGIVCTVVWEWGNYDRLFVRYPGLNVADGVPPHEASRVIVHRQPADGGGPFNWRVPTAEDEVIVVKTRYRFAAAEEAGRPTAEELLPWLPLPTEEISETIDRFVQANFNNTIGVHIRRTDHLPATKSSPDWLYLAEIAKVLSGAATIFLATDNVRTEMLIGQRFNPKVVIYPKQSGLEQRWPRTSCDFIDVRDDLLDLHLLSRTQYVLGSAHSTFSSFAIALNGDPRCRKLCVHDY